MTFDHVADPFIRGVLTADVPTAWMVETAMQITREHLQADAFNEDVPDEVLSARWHHLESAEYHYGNDDRASALAALRKCWSV